MTVDPDFVPSGQSVADLADVMPVKIALLNRKAEFLFVNQTFCDWVSLSKDEILGRPAREIVEVTEVLDDTKTPDDVRDLMSAGQSVEFRCRMKHPCGDDKFVRVRIVPHELGIGSYCFLRDITSEEISRINEMKYRAVLDTAGEGIIVMDDQGVVSAFNKAAETLFGYAAEEVIGQNVNLLMPDHIADNHGGFITRYLTTREPRIIGKKGVEAEGRRKDGSIFPAALAVAAFENNGRTTFTGIVRDVTQQRAYEDFLKQTEESLEAEVRRRGKAIERIFNMSDDILGMVNFEGYFTSVSPSVERITGVSAQECLKHPFMDYVHPDDRETLFDIYRTAMDGKAVSCEVRICNMSDSSIRWTQWSVQPDMEDRALYVVGRDITEDKLRGESQRQTQKMEAIGQLTGGIAHDFNNLLAVVTGSMDLLKKKIDKGQLGDADKYITATKQASARATQLTQRLLAFARRQPLAPVPVNTNDLITSIEDLLNRSIGPSITIETELMDSIWNTICDPNQLESSLLNCVVNSRDAMPDGGTITIKTENISSGAARVHMIPEAEWVMIEIKDTGEGMPDSVLARVFDPFFTTKPIGQGTGLGLSMLYGFVNQSEGHVRIESVVGEGSTVRLFLPRSNFNVVTATTDNNVKLEKIAAQGQTIMVVEDEPLVREIIVECMQACGFETVEAEDGDTALPIIKSDQRIDLLISDVGLPGMNGRQIADIARTYRPELKVLFVTGFAPAAMVRDQFLANGMDMMTKPFQVDQVASRVASMLREKTS